MRLRPLTLLAFLLTFVLLALLLPTEVQYTAAQTEPTPTTTPFLDTALPPHSFSLSDAPPSMANDVIESFQIEATTQNSDWQCDPSGGPSCWSFLWSVAMVSADEGWAVGEGSTILHYTGGSWQAISSPTSNWLYSVAMVSADEGWAVGWEGTILHYTGESWEMVNSPTSSWLLSLAMVSADEGWAVGGGGTILHYTNGSWETVSSPTSATLYSVAMVSANEGWAVGWSGAVLHFTNGSWQTVSSPEPIVLRSVAMVSADEGWSVGDLGTILHYTDGSWEMVNSPTSANLYSVAMVSADEGWAVADSGAVLHFTNGSWQTVSSPTSIWLHSVAMVSANEGWAVGRGGTILHYTNGSWQTVSSPTSSHLFSVAMVSANEGWAVGHRGTILHYTGGSWEMISSPTLGHLYSVAMGSANEGWAVGQPYVGQEVAILHYTNGSWQTVSYPGPTVLLSVAMVSADEGWAVGYLGNFQHYTGGSWETVNSPTSASLYSVAMVSADEGWAVGNGGAILHYTGSGFSVSPGTINLGTAEITSTFSIRTGGVPTKTWTVQEDIPWLVASANGQSTAASGSFSGQGEETVTINVDRAGLPSGTHSGMVNVISTESTATVNVSMEVAQPEVNIISPITGTTTYHGGSLLVKAAVTFGGAPLLDGQVEGRLSLGEPTFTQFTLYDDGAHEDGTADDGIYAARITLYNSLDMPSSGNPYPLTVTANTVSGSASETVNINVLPSSGAPAVTIEAGSPSAPDYFAGEQVTLTATLTYPDNSIHTDTAITVTVIAPDLSLNQVGLSNIAPDTWQGSYILPTDQEGGIYYFDARAIPPANSGFVDGWGTVSPAPYVYLDALSLADNTQTGPWLLYSQVPLSVCVTAGSDDISGATVNAQLTGPATIDGGELVEGDTPGCYQSSVLVDTPGNYTLALTATHTFYKTGLTNGSVEVSSQRAALSDNINMLKDDTIDLMAYGLAQVVQAADDGDYFKRKMKADEHRLYTQGTIDLLSAATAGGLQMTPWELMFPGWAESASEMGRMLTDEVIFGMVNELDNYAVRLESNGAAMAYYATKGKPSQGLPNADFLDAVTEEYAVLIPVEGNLSTNFADVLARTASDNHAAIIVYTDQTLTDLPLFTEPEEAAYIIDLGARQAANYWLSTKDLRYQTNYLNAVREKREEDEANVFRGIVIFVSESAIKVVAFVYFDGAGLAFVNSAALAWHAYLNSSAIAEDQRMRDLAIAIMHAGHRSQSIIYGNSVSALSLIRKGAPPPTPDGAMISIDLHRTKGTLGFARDIYADILLENTGSTTAYFGPKAYYEKKSYQVLQMIEGVTDLDTGDVVPVVELAPGETKTVRMYFKEDGEHDYGVPRKGEPIRFNLYAYTPYGAWLVHGQPGVEYNPTTVTSKVQDVSIKGDVRRPQTIIFPEDDTPFPLLTRVGSTQGSITYTMAIYASNPYPKPLPVAISQPLPTEMNVLNPRGGIVDGGQITWHRIIQPREQIALAYDFAYADYGTAVTLPVVSMSYDDLAGTLQLTLSSQPQSFQTKQPLWGKASASNPVGSGSSQIISTTVSNLDTDAGHQGTLITRLTNITGTEILSATTQVSLTAGDTQTYNLPYTAPIEEDTYILEVSLRQGNVTQSLINGFLTVGLKEVYLPLILK